MTLTAISIDRYLIIYKPVKARTIYTHGKIRLIVISIWVLSILIMSPILFTTKYEVFPIPKNIDIVHPVAWTLCIENWPNMELKLFYDIFLSCVLFFFPIAFMLYAYYTVSKILWFTSKDKNNSIKMALVETVQLVNTVGMSIKKEMSLNQANRPEAYQCGDSLNKSQTILPKQTLNSSSVLSSQAKEVNHKEVVFKKLNFKKKFNESIAIKESLAYQLKVCDSNKKLKETKYSFARRRMNILSPIIRNKNELAINKLIKSRQRVVKFLIILLVLFILSWLPYHINQLLGDFASIWEANFISGNLAESSLISKTLIEHLFPISLCLALANSATTPMCFI